MSLDESGNGIETGVPTEDRGRTTVAAGFVYILTNDRLNVLYAGSTNDLRKRVYHHKHRLVAGFTKKYNVHRLVYFETLPDMSVARLRGRQIKGMSRAKKIALIAALNPQQKDLFEELAGAKD